MEDYHIVREESTKRAVRVHEPKKIAIFDSYIFVYIFRAKIIRITEI